MRQIWSFVHPIFAIGGHGISGYDKASYLNNRNKCIILYWRKKDMEGWLEKGTFLLQLFDQYYIINTYVYLINILLLFFFLSIIVTFLNFNSVFTNALGIVTEMTTTKEGWAWTTNQLVTQYHPAQDLCHLRCIFLTRVDGEVWLETKQLLLGMKKLIGGVLTYALWTNDIKNRKDLFCLNCQVASSY